MNNRELKQKTISSMIWNTIQRFGTMIISFVSNIVLARLLMPEDFGSIGMLTIFISFSEVFIDGGFGSALIQKKNPTQDDYSTIFYWNLIVSTIVFVLLQFAAPLIAEFYHMPKLCNLLRVLSIILIINGFTVIQTTTLTKKLSFKLIAKIRIVAITIAVVVSIVAAYCGLGVWSLVLKNLLAALIGSTLFWIYNKWRPSRRFSWKSFKELFNFGGLMLLSNITNSLFENLQGLVIGRCYSAADLGHYSQAKRLDQIVTTSLSQVVTQVSFPVLAQVSDDKSLFIRTVRKNIIVTTYIIFPLEILLLSVAEPLIITLLSDKWIAAIPYYRIFCLYGLFISLNAINSSIYKALGNSKMYFFVQLTKRFIGISLLVFCIQFGVIGITWSIAISGFIWWVFNAFVNKKAISYGIFEQLRDVYKPLVVAIGLGAIIYKLQETFVLSCFAQLIIYIPVFSILYLTISKLLKFEGYEILINEVLKRHLMHKK